MKYVFYVPMMLLAAFFGYYTADHGHTDEELSFTEIKSNEERREELFDAMAESVRRDRTPAAEVANENQEILRLIDKNDPVQVTLAQLLISGREQGNQETANAELREGMKANPEKAFKALKKLFTGLDYEKYPMEKAALMALAIETNIGKPEDLRAMAMDSLLKDIPPSRIDPRTAKTEEEKNLSYSTTEKMFLPSIAYQAYLQSTTDVDVVMAETVTILETQSDYAVRNNIVNSFNQKYPQHDKVLEATVSERQIDIHFYQQRAPASTGDEK